MATVKSIDVAVRANTQQFEQGMQRVISSVNRVDDVLGNAGVNIPIIGKLTSAVQGLGPAGAAAAASLVSMTAVAGGLAYSFRALWGVMEPVLSSLDQTAKAAGRLGMATAELQRLQFGAELADVSAESLQAGLQKMSRTISDAAAGNKTASDSFMQLGLNVATISRMKPDQAFKAIADAISKVSNPMDRLRLTMEIFGRGGAGILTFLQEGADGITRIGNEADKLRLTISELDATQIQEFNDNVTRLKESFTGLATVLTTAVAPILNQIVQDMTKAIVEPSSGTSFMGGMISGMFDFAAATSLASGYFDDLNTRAALAANATAKATRSGAMSPAAVEAAAKEMEAAQKTQEELLKAGEAMKKGLMTPMEKFTARVKEIQTLRSVGAIDKLTSFRALADARKELADSDTKGKALEKERKEAADRLKAAGDKVKESVATPFEKFVEQVRTLQQLQTEGAISPETFSRAFAEARTEFGKSLESTAKTVFEAVRGPAAIERGGEAFSAFQQARRDSEKYDRMLEESRKQTKYLESMSKKAVVLAGAKL